MSVEPVLDPQMADALARTAALQPVGIDRDALPIAEVRAIFEATRRALTDPRPTVGEVGDSVLPSRHGPIPCRTYRGSGDGLPLIVYLHGGGWVLGSLETHDIVARLLCRETGADVLSVDYPLAPEHAPATMVGAIADAAAAVAAPRGFVLAGDSAGAHLAVLATLALASRDDARPRGLALYYGVLSRRMDQRSFAEFGDGRHGLGRERMAFYWKMLETRHEGDPATLDPAQRDLSALPPTLVVAAECDVLRDASKDFAARLAGASVPVDFRIARGMAHAFLAYGDSIDEARRTAADLGRFLRTLDPPATSNGLSGA